MVDFFIVVNCRCLNELMVFIVWSVLGVGEDLRIGNFMVNISQLLSLVK